jgi:hypothetical protein
MLTSQTVALTSDPSRSPRLPAVVLATYSHIVLEYTLVPVLSCSPLAAAAMSTHTTYHLKAMPEVEDLCCIGTIWCVCLIYHSFTRSSRGDVGRRHPPMPSSMLPFVRTHDCLPAFMLVINTPHVYELSGAPRHSKNLAHVNIYRYTV